MAGEATPAQIAGLLMAMRVRGETVAELAGAVRAMRARMIAVAAPPDAIDVCGTGGDNAGTLNVSTAVTFVLAGCGVPVAKHGNRALSSLTGGADVLAALGVNVDVPLERLPQILRAAGCAFLFAPRHHAALRHAAGPRVELGTRTIFNLLGPAGEPGRRARASSPACSTRTGRSRWPRRWRSSAPTRAWIVHGQGLDELTVAGESQVVALDGRRDPQLHGDAGGGRARPRAGRGDPRRRRGGERRGARGAAARRGRTLSRHRAAQRRRRADRGRAGRRPAGTASRSPPRAIDGGAAHGRARDACAAKPRRPTPR